MAGTHNPLLPEMATVIETVQETHNIKTFRVRFDDEEKMKNFTFQPGQVGQLSVFGVGESTFVINSSPTRMDYLQFSVMKAGENTAALHKLNAGDKIGVRAPLGNWFPYEQWKGKNVFFIGGGIGMAPIRTIMVYLLDNRKDYGDISLLYGAKTPADLSFQSDMPEWLERKDLNVTLTIDNPADGWEHKVGLIPNVLKEIGPKPKNVGDVLATVLENVQAKNSNLETFFNTPAVKLVHADGKVTGVIAKDESGKYIQFNASKGVILATGDYMNNEAMVKRWCPDVDGYDKKQYQKTGDGHIMAIDAGAKMENLGHTKMMHDFDSGLMYEEPFLYVNMEGKRFCNEDTGFVYMGNITKYLPRYNGANVDANHPDGSLGWYCQIYDSDYMSYANSPVPEQVMTKYIPGAVENPQGVFTNLIDTYKADTIEELAALLDVPADELQKTIDRYNELCDQGTDADFGKKSAYMHKIEKAPFWGVRKHIRVSSIDSGVNTNANGQALDADGNVIEGLYCVGNVGGVFYGGADYPFHQTGLSLGRCYTFGMLAAKHAMGQL